MKRNALILCPWVRVAFTLTAAVCSAGINGGLLDVFSGASSDPSLHSAPQVRRGQAKCETLPASAERTNCAHTLARRVLAVDTSPEESAAR